MNIEVLKVGPLETNCYIVYKDNKCLIIDPGDDENFIVSRIKELELDVLAILITHNHEDHIKCKDSLSMMYNVKVYDYDNLFEGPFQIDNFKFEVIYTKGHSKDSITFYFKDYKIMFCGDFVFYENVGRVDLPTGSYVELIDSINKLKEYDEDIKLYPGHGKITSIKHELKHNKYFE